MAVLNLYLLGATPGFYSHYKGRCFIEALYVALCYYLLAHSYNFVN